MGDQGRRPGVELRSNAKGCGDACEDLGKTRLRSPVSGPAAMPTAEASQSEGQACARGGRQVGSWMAQDDRLKNGSRGDEYDAAVNRLCSPIAAHRSNRRNDGPQVKELPPHQPILRRAARSARVRRP